MLVPTAPGTSAGKARSRSVKRPATTSSSIRLRAKARTTGVRRRRRRSGPVVTEHSRSTRFTPRHSMLGPPNGHGFSGAAATASKPKLARQGAQRWMPQRRLTPGTLARGLRLSVLFELSCFKDASSNPLYARVSAIWSTALDVTTTFDSGHSGSQPSPLSIALTICFTKKAFLSDSKLLLGEAPTVRTTTSSR